jgi:hypothetical protein
MSEQSFGEFWDEYHCRKCGDMLTTGTAHGHHHRAIGYKYCHKCDEFIEFKSYGFAENEIDGMKEFIKMILLEDAK